MSSATIMVVLGRRETRLPRRKKKPLMEESTRSPMLSQQLFLISSLLVDSVAEHMVIVIRYCYPLLLSVIVIRYCSFLWALHLALAWLQQKCCHTTPRHRCEKESPLLSFTSSAPLFSSLHSRKTKQNKNKKLLTKRETKTVTKISRARTEQTKVVG
jgi:hypothetical protein